MKPNIDNIPLTVGDVQYLGRDLPPEIKNVLQHCVDLRDQQEDLEFKHAQVDTAKRAMEAALDEMMKQYVEQQKEAS